jgi:hypothetical protein
MISVAPRPKTVDEESQTLTQLLPRWMGRGRAVVTISASFLYCIKAFYQSCRNPPASLTHQMEAQATVALRPKWSNLWLLVHFMAVERLPSNMNGSCMAPMSTRICEPPSGNTLKDYLHHVLTEWYRLAIKIPRSNLRTKTRTRI